MEITSVRPGYEVWRPNREKAQTKTTKAIVALVLLVSAGLLVVITIGGWTRLEGTSVAIMTLLWAALYVVFALLVARWNRGVLPVASALAIILAIFAAVAAPGWFARDKPGLSPPPLPDDRIGLLTILVVIVQLLLIAVAMVAFSQNWHVEEERPVGGVPSPERTRITRSSGGRGGAMRSRTRFCLLKRTSRLLRPGRYRQNSCGCASRGSSRWAVLRTSLTASITREPRAAPPAPAPAGEPSPGKVGLQPPRLVSAQDHRYPVVNRANSSPGSQVTIAQLWRSPELSRR